jgi:hypothetical protein
VEGEKERKTGHKGKEGGKAEQNTEVRKSLRKTRRTKEVQKVRKA